MAVKSARPSKHDQRKAKPYRGPVGALTLPVKRLPSKTRPVKIRSNHPGKYDISLKDIPKDTRNVEADLATLETLTGALDSEVSEARDRNRRKPGRPLDLSEKAIIIRMYHGGYNVKAISTFLERTDATVRGCIEEYRPTTDMAKAKLKAGAERLANRILDMGSVEESLEVLDRLDVLPKKSKDAPQTAQQFNIIVGGGSSGTSTGPPALPMPSQEQIEAAKEAVVVQEEPKEAQ